MALASGSDYYYLRSPFGNLDINANCSTFPLDYTDIYCECLGNQYI